MGACATKPKVLKEGGTPEPVKEEVVVATGGGDEVVDKGAAVDEEEEKRGVTVEKDIGGDYKLETEIAEIVDDSNKRRSLSNLFKENEAEKEPTESDKAPAEPEKLETSESSENPTVLAVAKEEPSTAVKEQSVEKPEEPVKQEKVVAEAPEKLETSKSTNKPSEPAVVKEEPLTVKERSAEKSEEPIKQEKTVTEEPVVVPGQETLKSEIPAEPVPVSGAVNAPVKVDTEKVTGEVTPGEAPENTKITETVEEKKPEEAK